MRPGLFNLLAAVSLVLCLAASVAWVQSYEPPGGGGETLTAGHCPVFWGVAVPHWFLVSLFAAGPAVALQRWGVRVYRRRRIVAGRCPGCGYDLRATPGAVSGMRHSSAARCAVKTVPEFAGCAGEDTAIP